MFSLQTSPCALCYLLSWLTRSGASRQRSGQCQPRWPPLSSFLSGFTFTT